MHYIQSFSEEENLFGSWEGLPYQAKILHLTCKCISGDEFLVDVSLLQLSFTPLCGKCILHLEAKSHLSDHVYAQGSYPF